MSAVHGIRLSLLAILLLTSPILAEPEDAGLYLFRVPVTLAERDVLPLGSRVSLSVDVPNPEYLVSQLDLTNVAVRGVDGNVVNLEFETPGMLKGDPLPRHSAPSFVVDFDEQTIAELTTALQGADGVSDSVSDLLEFVDEVIRTKSYRRDFDIASQVAKTREGDCTEHAVLLAALARAVGRPSRVVIGILLVETADDVVAYGHAWTEIHGDDGWQLADATRPQHNLPNATTHYLPLLEIDNEGPGYYLSVLKFAALQPARIGAVQTARSPVARLQR
jgi:transglutaminase-like putative cysteine protease